MTRKLDSTAKPEGSLDTPDEEQGGGQVVPRSHTAKEISDLQDRILRLANNRERLPQPLFWSLFHSRISEIKKNKELARLLNEVLG